MTAAFVARVRPKGRGRDGVARQPPARTKCPFATGTARRRRTACEGCSGMTVAFVAPRVRPKGRGAMMSLGSLRRGRSALSLPERLGDGEPRAKRVRG